MRCLKVVKMSKTHLCCCSNSFRFASTARAGGLSKPRLVINCNIICHMPMLGFSFFRPFRFACITFIIDLWHRLPVSFVAASFAKFL